MQILDISTAVKLLPNACFAEHLFDLDIATIGLRFVHHANDLIDQKRVAISIHSSGQLEAFYGKCVESIGHVLDTANLDALLTVDTSSLIMGVLCVHDQHVREHLLQRYFNLLLEFKEQGVEPIPPHRQKLLKALLESLDMAAFAPAVTMLITEQESHDEVIPEHAIDLLEQVLVATHFGSQPIAGGEQQLLVQLAKPMAMNAVRDNDIASVAAIMLATELAGYSDYLESDYLNWLLRQGREDGVFGNWELEGASTPSALLLNTMFSYWALSYVGSEPANRPESVYPGIQRSTTDKLLVSPDFDQACVLSSTELELKCLNICQWLDRNIERFTIDIHQHNKMEMTDRIKPAVEMFLTTFLILETFKQEADNPLYQWASHRAGVLYDLMPWSAMIEYFRANLSTSLGLLLFPLAAKSSGKPIPYEQDIRAILSNRYSLAQERPPMRKMDFCFLARLMQVNLDETPNLAEQYQATLLAKQVHPLWFSISSLYDVTHTIFYGTDFGQQHTDVTELSKSWNEQFLHDLAIDSMLRGDLDLAGEFILCCFYTDITVGNKFSFICKAFFDSMPTVGPVKGPDLHLRPHLDEFDACYHTSLVALAALAELWKATATHPKRYQTALWDQLSIAPIQHKATPTTEVLDLKSMAQTWLKQGLLACDSLASRQDKHTLLVTDKHSKQYILSVYHRALDFLNVRETSKLYNQAVAQGLAFGELRLIHRQGDQTGFATLREYTEGKSIYHSEGKQHFAMLGAFSYHLHQKLSLHTSDALRNIWQEWVTSLNSDVCGGVPASIIQRIAYAEPTTCKVIHGDLNSTNLIFNQQTMDVYAIDFDNLGIGLPEQELALALLNENRGAEPFQTSKQQLVSAYIEEGGHLDLELLDAFIITAPAYVLACETRKQGKAPGMLVVDRCRSQIQDRLKVCLGRETPLPEFANKL